MSDYHDANTIIRLLEYDNKDLSFSHVERMSHLWYIEIILNKDYGMKG